MTRVFSGIQPTGQKHIGNYLGAIRHYVADQERYGAEAIFCVVDLHSMTQPFEPAELTTSTRDTFATLSPRGSIPSVRSCSCRATCTSTPSWPGSSTASATTGELAAWSRSRRRRPGASRSRSGSSPTPCCRPPTSSSTSPTACPVGEDQRQHLELARDIAQRFNARYGELFPPPQAAIPPTAARISDLQEPTRKMSTSSLSSEDGRLLMLDEPDVIRRKFKRAVTDSEEHDPPRLGRQARRLEPARDPSRASAARRSRRSRPATRARATATSRATSPRRWWSCSRPSASATRS